MSHYDIYFHSSIDSDLLTEELHLDRTIASGTFLAGAEDHRHNPSDPLA